MILFLLLPVVVNCLSVLHVTDFHLDVDYSTNGNKNDMCHETGNKPFVGEYGDFACDSPESLVKFSIKEAKRLVPNPDVIFWTGDTIPHIKNYSIDYSINALNITTSLLKSEFSNVHHVLPAYGNHDAAPSNSFTEEDDLYTRTWDLWKDFLGEECKSTFLHGGYYKKRINGATFLVLNTNLYYKENNAFDSFEDKEDPAGQFKFLEMELEYASQCRKMWKGKNTYCDSVVHIVAHIPPGVFEKLLDFPWFRGEYNKKYLDIVIKYSNVIKYMFYGHHHTDTFNLIKDDSGKTVQVSLMAPSITPWVGSLPGDSPHNPAFRVYDIDDNNNLNGIKTYFLDLVSMNKGPAQFEFEYSFRETYGVKESIDPIFMDNLLSKIKGDEELFRQYLNRNTRKVVDEAPELKFRRNHLCAMEYADYPRQNKCAAGEESSGLNVKYKIVLVALVVIIIIGVIIIFVLRQ